MATEIVIDYETFYSREYSLRKLTPVEYILHPLFRCHGAAVMEGVEGKAVWYDPDELELFFQNLKQRQKAGEKFTFISHNALFDQCITVWKYLFVPDLMIDTLGMARVLYYHKTASVSLAKVTEHIGIGMKTDTILKVEGMTLEGIKEAGLYDAYVRYALNDAALCRQAYLVMREDFPKQEYLVNDMVIRMACVPRFKIDGPLLAEHLASVIVEKETLLNQLGVTDRGNLLSNEKFAESLRTLGVEPPMKTSPATGKATYAFAKTDTGMAELQEHDDPRVQALVAARLGIKSTIEETRTSRFLNISYLDWGKLGGQAGWMPIPLRYAGAHTHRLSGDWSLNLQNLGRKSTLRKALKAPKGHQVVTADSAQVEARIVAFLAGQDDLVEDFRQGVDIYSKFAGEEVYRYPVDKKNNPTERFVGKTSILGLGFGMGGPKFDATIATQSRLQLGTKLELGLEKATEIVQAYRRRYANIKKAWDTLNNLLPYLAGQDSGLTFGPFTLHRQKIVGPTGLPLYYNDLRQVPSERGYEWVFTYARETKRLFGGKLYENLVQNLARLIIFDVALRMRRHYPKIPLALQVHDELVYIVPDALVDEFKQALLTEMGKPPGYAAGLPLAAEAGVGPTYGDAK